MMAIFSKSVEDSEYESHLVSKDVEYAEKVGLGFTSGRLNYSPNKRAGFYNFDPEAEKLNLRSNKARGDRGAQVGIY